MKLKTLSLTLAAAMLLTLAPITTTRANTPCKPCCIKRAPQPEVDIAICLDTSSSMNGLIESAKQKLWAIVNELAQANPKPKLRVALYHYGNDGLSAETGWVKQLCPLTNDLDKIYEELFKLRTNGGTELVARVVKAATENLNWTTQKNALKMIVVAGNEAATQDKKFELHDICKAAINKGIVINTIFCGNAEQGKNSGWANAANWGEGQYSAIDQNRGTVVINTPYDKQIIELNIKLNATYMGYGQLGKKNKARQKAQDMNAESLNAPAAASRAASKATKLYVNSSWDVVDAVKNKKLDLAKTPAKDLPKPMQNMSPKERVQYVKKLTLERQELQKKICELNNKRLEHQKNEMKKRGMDESKSFDGQLRKVIQQQAEKRGLSFKK